MKVVKLLKSLRTAAVNHSDASEIVANLKAKAAMDKSTAAQFLFEILGKRSDVPFIPSAKFVDDVETLVRVSNGEATEDEGKLVYVRNMGELRPLINLQNFNSKARDVAAKQGLKSISAQPVREFLADVTITYKDNRACAAANIEQVEEIISSVTKGKVHVFPDFSRNGVRLYCRAELHSTGFSLRECADVDEVREVVEAMQAAGITPNEEELKKELAQYLVGETMDTMEVTRVLSKVGVKISAKDVDGEIIVKSENPTSAERFISIFYGTAVDEIQTNGTELKLLINHDEEMRQVDILSLL